MRGDERGQAHTLEGVMAALLVVLSLLFAVQISVTGPLASNTAREGVSDQLRGVGESTLAVADERDALRAAALDWNASRPAFRGSNDDGHYTDGRYLDGEEPSELAQLLNDSFADDRTIYNVDIVHWQNGARESSEVIYSGEPTDGAVTVSRSVTLYDDDTVASGETLEELSGELFYADETSTGHVYTVVRVEVTLWRA
mgnify:CR=1 FL=1